MKITLSATEIIEILKKSFPTKLLLVNSKIMDIETKGYPEKEYIITIEKEE